MTLTKIGCCGFSTAREKYFREFSVVEIQQTFYNLPRLSTAERWRREAPHGFEFTAKAWQLITHEPTSPTYRRLKPAIEPKKRQHYGSFKPTDEVMRAWGEFHTFARNLRVEKVIFQCPASFRSTPENKKNLFAFFDSIDRSGITCIWEPRGEWREDEIRELCAEGSLVHCADPFQSRPVADNIRYYRLHGLTGYRYHYTQTDLKNLLDKLDIQLPTYVMFNNASMFEDAKRFQQMLTHARQ
ncbi:MAG: DUF72 domain-containing protein [Candidatus Abyssobacteria bacterium SURF_17]|uniref:DUF72 domain-containing protein n=1 Tax=Candidatus Abyssobacteria bacterium SURF_17 TaxID=2093361 RepID=A0A419EWS0_9BACT|nr:MAG: DUF72 domain-containing protein [Candidatus Abyssubacteria bacterium SURF_17]